MENTEEIWKDIAGCEGYFQISNKGNARSLDRDIVRSTGAIVHFSSKMLKLECSRRYLYVGLNVNGRKWQMLAHRAVAIAFIPNPLNKPYINHKNGIRHDNRVENLEWCTSSENRIHAIETGLAKVRGIENSSAKLTNEQVLKIREMSLQGMNCIEIQKEIKIVHASRIVSIVARRTWRHI